MQRATGVAIATVVGAVAIGAPILVSVRLAWEQSLTGEKARASSYARDVLRRSEETAAQFSQAIDKLNHDHFPPCSPDEINLMRQLDLGSSYIQAVGRVEGNSVTCTSLGTREPISIGPPELTTDQGVVERNYLRLPIANGHLLSVVSKDGVAIFIDPSLLTDTPTEGPGISIAVFVPSSSNREFIATQGTGLRPEWLKVIPKGGEISFLDEGYVVSVVRSAQYDIAAIAAVPELYANKLASQFAAIFVPIGLLCGAGLAWAVMYISRIQLSLPKILIGAARRREFFVEYQPVVDLATKRWIGAEALVRWRRAGGDVVRPDNFIPIAEESGVITRITACVGEIVAADLPGLLGIDREFFVAINLSAPDLRSMETVELFRRMLISSKAQPKNISAEATERGFLQGNEAREILEAIRKQGIVVAIDDFGTGYSSLSCLQSLGIDMLKIDRSFVETIDTDGATSQVVPHIIEMARSLKLLITAEGVETEAQAYFLSSHGVHFAQGWLFGKPMPIGLLRESLHAQQANTPASTEALFRS
jgi:sensor c-di-GMP phosphodiesterase-like protein